MLNPDIQLHFEALNPDALPTSATRDGFGVGIVEAAEHDDRVVALCADVTDSVRLTTFKEKFPDRYVEVGVAEQNMAAIASGLAAAGKRPFIVSYAVFSPGRNWEHIRTTIALNDVPVVVVGMHAGLSVGADGASHQALEDMTLMRVLPNMQVLTPADSEEARKAVHAALKSNKPTYLRCTREKTPVFTTHDTPFLLGGALRLFHPENPRAVLIGVGPIVYDALLVAHELHKRGVPVSVLSIQSLKPMDIPTVLEAVREAGAVVTLEDHQILGGLGGTIAEITAQNTPVPVEMIAVHDRFGQSGTPEELRNEYGLNHEAILRAVTRVIERKNNG